MADPPTPAQLHGSLHAILPLLEVLEDEGLDPRAILEAAGIPRSALEDPHIRLPQVRFEALWRAAIAATGDPALALRVSTRVKPGTLGVIGYLASASASPRNAFELIRGLTPLLWEGVECELETDDAVAFIRCRTGRRRPSRFTAEYAIGLTVTLSRALGPARADPLEARFSHRAPDHADAYARILGLPVRFDAGEDGVLFPISTLDRSNPSADAALRQLLERHAADQLARILADAPFPQRVRARVVSLLPRGGLTADSLAADFSLSSRTLRRRLREEGTSYQRILDDVRAELAHRYLARDGLGADEAARLLGFSDPSAFSKAFRRWTGRTPAAFVRSRGPEPDGAPRSTALTGEDPEADRPGPARRRPPR